MTEAKKIELTQTENALAELSNVLVRLSDVLDEKKNAWNAEKKALTNQAKEDSENLALLKTASQNIIQNIDNVISKLDKVLENDGSSNDNN